MAMSNRAARIIPFCPIPVLEAAFTNQLCQLTAGGAQAIQPITKGANQLNSELSETPVDPGPSG